VRGATAAASILSPAVFLLSRVHGVRRPNALEQLFQALNPHLAIQIGVFCIAEIPPGGSAVKLNLLALDKGTNTECK